uniref:Uncharacterized protein n=1 Tax=Arundo donax TaxID=35708 RepID=A0A0A9A6I4_ARUDO
MCIESSGAATSPPCACSSTLPATSSSSSTTHATLSLFLAEPANLPLPPSLASACFLGHALLCVVMPRPSCRAAVICFVLGHHVRCVTHQQVPDAN